MIDYIFTPENILNNYNYKEKAPAIIFIEDFPSFDDLLKVKDEIKNLNLLPIKSEEIYNKYHSSDLETLLESIEFKGEKFLLQENFFPYNLPCDTSQKILWINNASFLEIKNYLLSKFQELNLSPDDVILFERPNNISTKLVKKSFPYIRHIHMWHKK